MDQPQRWSSLSSSPPPAPVLEPPVGVPAGPAPGRHDPFGTERQTLRKRFGGILAAIGALLVKFWAVVKGALLFLPKLKLLTTSGTMLVSIAAYSLIWGWQFAVGFVILLFVHEMGHVLALRREGIKASAPMFIPFMGALITSKSLGDNALAEARVGLAGPILGSLGAAALIPVYEVTHNTLFLALAFTGFFLNLFNLLPVLPLDGGRAMAAMAPWMWFVGFAGLIAVAFVFPNPIIFIIIAFGGLETYKRWKRRRSGDLVTAAYYRVSPRNRLLVAGVYIGLIASLAVAMSATHVVRTLG